jgi:hypothetical protein
MTHDHHRGNNEVTKEKGHREDGLEQQQQSFPMQANRSTSIGLPHHRRQPGTLFASLATPTKKAAVGDLFLATLRVHLVPKRGLEPPRFYPLVPETSASTNSATSAQGAQCNRTLGVCQ